jgi:uncharacterized protein (DUF58 family)
VLTDRGWTAVGVGAALLVLWVALGEIELLAAGVLILAAVAVAIVMVWWSVPRVGISRRLYPTLVHEGDRATVEAIVTNRSRRALTNATLSDAVGDLGTAVFQIGSLAPGETGDAQYQIVCRPRGVYPVGPVTVTVTDAVRLASSGHVGDTVDRLIVYPKVEDLRGFPLTRGRDPSFQASRPEFAHRGGEDFYTLREYVHGDDLRRVHWPTSAKKDELMIRQLETPWQSRALVMLDIRQMSYESVDCFEKAVSGAASVVRHLAHSGFDAELWAGGVTTTSVSQYAAVMEQLAVVNWEQRFDIRAVAARLRMTGTGGALILVSGVPDHDLLEVHRLLSRDYRSTLLMTASEARASSELSFQRAGAVTIGVRPNDSWSAAWRKTMDKTWLGASAG